MLEQAIRNALFHLREVEGIDINTSYPLSRGATIVYQYLHSQGIDTTYLDVYRVLGTIQGVQLEKEHYPEV